MNRVNRVSKVNRVGRLSGGGAFSFLSVPDLANWWDSTEHTYQERTGASATTPALVATDPVGSWKDKIGGIWYGPDADGKRPTIAVSGVRHVRFDATDDGMAGIPSDLTITRPFTLVLIGRAGTDNTGSRRMLQSLAGNSLLTLTDRNDDNNWFLGGANRAAGEVPSGTPRSVGFTVGAAGSTLQPYKNGLAVGSASAVDDWGALRFASMGLTADVGDCDVRHILRWPRALTAAEMLFVHNVGVT